MLVSEGEGRGSTGWLSFCRLVCSGNATFVILIFSPMAIKGQQGIKLIHQVAAMNVPTSYLSQVDFFFFFFTKFAIWGV